MILQPERPTHRRADGKYARLANYYGNLKRPQIEYTTVQDACEKAGLP